MKNQYIKNIAVEDWLSPMDDIEKRGRQRRVEAALYRESAIKAATTRYQPVTPGSSYTRDVLETQELCDLTATGLCRNY